MDLAALIEAEIVQISRAYAECCADCEHQRTTEKYPMALWSAAWDRRIKLQSQWAETAKRLTDRPTEPPALQAQSLQHEGTEP